MYLKARLRGMPTAAIVAVLVVVCLSALSGWVQQVEASGIHPTIKQQLLASGRLARTSEIISDAHLSGMNAAETELPTQNNGSQAGVSTRIPCILVEFSDNAWAGGSVNTSTEQMADMLFSAGTYPTGSMRDYFLEVSYGQYEIEGDVYGPIILPQTYAYYLDDLMGVSPIEPNSRTIFRDAITAADDLIDYALYDADGDTFVDGVMIVVAGYGFEESGDAATILSHQWSLPTDEAALLDGVYLSSYTIQPEEHGPPIGGGVNGIGTSCHQWAHLLSVPDLSDEDGSSWGIGDWSLMGTGHFLDESRTPAHLDPWSKMMLGWVTVDVVTANRVDQSIPSFATSPAVLRLWLAGMSDSEYFLVCNRDQDGFDAALPGSGLMVLHVDETVSDNRNEYIPGETDPLFHYKVAMVQADGNYDLERLAADNPGDQGDLYTGETIEFDDLTVPGSRGYAGLVTEVAVWDISPSGPVMTANLDITFSRPKLQVVEYWFDDQSGDGDGVADPGESVEMLLTVTNLWKSTTDIDITVTSSNPNVVFTNGSSHINGLNKGESHTNYNDRITFTVAPEAPPAIATFLIDFTAEDGAFESSEILRADLGPKQVLIVDADGDYRDKDYREYYYELTLENLEIPYTSYDILKFGHPDAQKLIGFPMVCWYTGIHRVTPLPPEDSIIIHDDVVAMQGYLDDGGRLFLTGQDIAEYISQTADSQFVTDYLGVRYASSTVEPVFAVGLRQDAIGVDTLVLMGPDCAANQANSDNFTPLEGTTISYRYSLVYPPQGEGGIGGITYTADSFKVVLWGFGLESITAVSGIPGFTVSREQAFQHVIDWLLTTQIDTDNDGISDDVDNCPSIPNFDQADADGDGAGDACDDDDDDDGIADTEDNCPLVYNPGQENADDDEYGDVCDDDDDNDGVADTGDNCPFVSNPGQENADDDAYGDVCDDDDDNDGVADTEDNCPFLNNPEQENADDDEYGDVCDDDDDNDGLLDTQDNCPLTYNPGQEDADGDSIGDACEDCDCTGHCDLDLSGDINPVDVVLIVNFVYKNLDSRLPLPTACPNENGDWDCNGDVNPVDVVFYTSLVYKNSGESPCNPCAE